MSALPLKADMFSVEIDVCSPGARSDARVGFWSAIIFATLPGVSYSPRSSSPAVRAKLAEGHYGAMLVDTREMAGELLYYLRDVPVPLYVWPAGPVPMDHDEMTRPFTSAAPEPILFVSLNPCPGRLAASFGTVADLGTESIKLVTQKARIVHFCRLANYRSTSRL